jgi:hypothetical protein
MPARYFVDTNIAPRCRHSGKDAGIQRPRMANLDFVLLLKSAYAIGELPSMALDSGIPAGMTVYWAIIVNEET